MLGVAFFVLSPGDSTTGRHGEHDDTAGEHPEHDRDGRDHAGRAPAAAVHRIRVRNGKPVGGVRTIKVTTGSRARIEVRSTDTSDEVHLHGYDIKRDLNAGGRVRFSFKANAEGIFELELEGSGTQIARIEVQPR